MNYNINKLLSVLFIMNVFCPELKAQWFLATTEVAGGNDIQFLDENTGWLAGNSGIIKSQQTEERTGLHKQATQLNLFIE